MAPLIGITSNYAPADDGKFGTISVGESYIQAVIQAGGFRAAARRDKVIIIRRGPDGRPMMRTTDMRREIFEPASVDTVPLRRFDIVYVPRSGISEAGLFIQQYFRDIIPVNFGFSYAINPQAYSSGSVN